MTPAPAMPIAREPAATPPDWRALADRLRRFAVALVGHRRRDLADDLVQDAIARLLARQAHLSSPPYPVARVTLTRLYLDHERAARRRAARAIAWALCQSAPAPNSGAGAEAPAIHAALERLSPLQRAAFVLRVVDELPTDAVAEVLNTTPRTVRSALHTARSRLRTSLAHLDGGDS